MKSATIILPTYNERENVGIIIPQIFEQEEKTPGWEFSIVVVDDTSPDKTAEKVVELQKKYKKLFNGVKFQMLSLPKLSIHTKRCQVLSKTNLLRFVQAQLQKTLQEPHLQVSKPHF